MKKQFVNAAVIAGLAFSVIACDSNKNETGTGTDTTRDTNTTVNTETTTASSTGTYAAMADSVERGSQQGYYLNPRTGQPYASLRVDRSTGRVTTEAGEPVWRYVDNRTWQVYGYQSGSQDWRELGEARMQNQKLEYRSDNNQWVDYDNRWKYDDGILEGEWKKETENSKTKIEDDGDRKTKMDDGTKIKTESDGDTKIKTSDGTKIKSDDDKLKIKTKDGKKIKVDEDGVKTKD
jgi:hypothetical protein